MSMHEACAKNAHKHASKHLSSIKTCMRTNDATGQDRTFTGEGHKRFHMETPVCVCEVFVAQEAS